MRIEMFSMNKFNILTLAFCVANVSYAAHAEEAIGQESDAHLTPASEPINPDVTSSDTEADDSIGPSGPAHADETPKDEIQKMVAPPTVDPEGNEAAPEAQAVDDSMGSSDPAHADETPKDEIQKMVAPPTVDPEGNEAAPEAQAAAKDDPVEFEEMVVTGTRYEMGVLDNPVPVTVIDQQAILRSGARNIGDLLSHEANIDIGPEGTPWNGKARIRGLYGDRVLILIDGERYNSHVGATYGGAELSAIDIEQVERIEVVRGPSSVLYGSAAVGGVVNLITKKARIREEPYFEKRASVGFDSVNQMSKVSAGLNAGGERMAFNLGVSWRNAENLDTPVGELPHSSFEDSAISLDLNYALSAKESLRLAWQYSLAEDVKTPPFAAYDPKAAIPIDGLPAIIVDNVKIPALSVTTITQPSVERQKFSIGYTAEDPFPWMQQLKASIYMNRIDHQVHMYTDIEPDLPTHPVNIIPRAEIGMAIETIGLNMQEMSRVGSRHFITSGLDIFRDKAYGPSNTVTDVILYDLVPVFWLPTAADPLNGTLESAGFYVQDEIAVTEKFSAFIGGRYEYFQTENNPDTPKSPDVDNNDDAITAALGLVYRLAPSVSLTANMGTAFRMPTLKERYYYGAGAGGLIMVGNPDLEPEESFNVEVGAKFASSRLTGDISIFRNKVDDLILFGTIPGGKITFLNLGEAELLGAELNLDYAMTDFWSTFMKLAYTRGEDEKEGDPIEAIPPLGAELGLRYEDYGRFEWMPPFWSEFTASIYDNQDRIPNHWASDGKTAGLTAGFTTYNLQAGMDMSRFGLFKGMKTADLRLGVKNLTDKYYTSFPVIVFAGDVSDRLAQPGRNVQISFKATW